MAFECQGNTEACLANKYTDFVDHSSKDQVELDLSETDSKNQGLGTVTKLAKEAGVLEISKPIGFNPKLEITSFCGSKQLSSDEISLNCRKCITDLPPALISEIFNCLEPKELGIVSCVSTVLHRVASEHHVWKEFYCERWGIPIAPKLQGSEALAGDKSWKEIFVEREFRSKTFLGRYSIEMLYGHTEPVRAVFILASAKLLFTSGYDSIVRMWNAEEGVAVASSWPLGCTIRAVAADTRLLVAGGTDAFIHCWRAVEGLPHLFDLKNQSTEFRLWEHEGPITCLALDPARIFSGSWDMTLRVWDRKSLKCLHVLSHSDWVWGLVPRDATVASISGSDVYVWEINTGTLAAVMQNAHAGNIYALARSNSGNLLFSGGEDGAIHMFQITSHQVEENVLAAVASWIPHTGPVHSLAFEFPWLVSASSDGKLSLIDVRKLLRTGKHSSMKYLRSNSVEPPQRMLHGFGCNLLAVDIGADRIVCGGDGGVVRIWNFSQALEAEQRAQALRGLRLENRMRRRKLQMEMNGKCGRGDQCSVAAAKKNPMNGDKSSAWHKHRVVNGKAKA